MKYIRDQFANNNIGFYDSERNIAVISLLDYSGNFFDFKHRAKIDSDAEMIFTNIGLRHIHGICAIINQPPLHCLTKFLLYTDFGIMDASTNAIVDEKDLDFITNPIIQRANSLLFPLYLIAGKKVIRNPRNIEFTTLAFNTVINEYGAESKIASYSFTGEKQLEVVREAEEIFFLKKYAAIYLDELVETGIKIKNLKIETVLKGKSFYDAANSRWCSIE